MMAKIHRRLHSDEGFTLVELMVVVLIIAILMAIAIPTFLGARQKAQDRAAQSNLRNALTAEKVYYVDNETYTNTVADISAIEPALSFAQGIGAPAASGTVNIGLNASGANVCLTALSASGSVFVLADVSTGASAGTYYGTAAVADCNDATVAALSTTGW